MFKLIGKVGMYLLFVLDVVKIGFFGTAATVDLEVGLALWIFMLCIVFTIPIKWKLKANPEVSKLGFAGFAVGWFFSSTFFNPPLTLLEFFEATAFLFIALDLALIDRYYLKHPAALTALFASEIIRTWRPD